jgi:hypothetical protein
MAKHEPALEGAYKISTPSLNHYSIKITFADYDSGEIKGYFLAEGTPFSFASFHRESDRKSSLYFEFTYNMPELEKGGIAGRVVTLNLTADDLTYNRLYGTLTGDLGKSINVEFLKWL